MRALYLNYASLFCENKFIGRECENQDSPIAKTSRFGPFNYGQERGNFCFDTSACLPYVLLGNRSSGQPLSIEIGLLVALFFANLFVFCLVFTIVIHNKFIGFGFESMVEVEPNHFRTQSIIAVQ